jgi:hypothetical protein
MIQINYHLVCFVSWLWSIYNIQCVVLTTWQWSCKHRIKDLHRCISEFRDLSPQTYYYILKKICSWYYKSHGQKLKHGRLTLISPLQQFGCFWNQSSYLQFLVIDLFIFGFWPSTSLHLIDNGSTSVLEYHVRTHVRCSHLLSHNQVFVESKE